MVIKSSLSNILWKCIEGNTDLFAWAYSLKHNERSSWVKHYGVAVPFRGNILSSRYSWYPILRRNHGVDVIKSIDTTLVPGSISITNYDKSGQCQFMLTSQWVCGMGPLGRHTYALCCPVITWLMFGSGIVILKTIHCHTGLCYNEVRIIVLDTITSHFAFQFWLFPA